MATGVTIDFCVAGFSKCGTTSLCAGLQGHPAIFIPAVKEPRYFSSDRFEQRARGYDAMYAPATPGQLLGDGSPVYSSATHADIAIARIQANNPGCRFIFIARHPRKRIESFYREMHHSGAHFGVRPCFPLGEFLQEYPAAIDDALFLDRITPFIEAFGREAVLPVFLEDFRADMRSVLELCCEHLGVDAGQLPRTLDTQLNAGSDKLYDTRLLRWLLGFPRFKFIVGQMAPEKQNTVLRRSGLRRSFGKRTIAWDESAEALFRDRVAPQARDFLAFCGKPLDYWDL